MPEVILAAERVMYGAPLVLVFKVKPVAPVCDPIVAAVVLSPGGVVQVPTASVQYLNSIEPTLLVDGTVKLKK